MSFKETYLPDDPHFGWESNCTVLFTDVTGLTRPLLKTPCTTLPVIKKYTDRKQD